MLGAMTYREPTVADTINERFAPVQVNTQEEAAQTRREPGRLRRSCRLPPIEGAEAPQEARPHTPHQAVDQQRVTPVPGEAQVPRLAQHQPGSTTEAPDQFPGYYTLHSLKNGKVTGMLPVNGYSGQVWYHTWHGAFIWMMDLHA